MGRRLDMWLLRVAAQRGDPNPETRIYIIGHGLPSAVYSILHLPFTNFPRRTWCAMQGQRRPRCLPALQGVFPLKHGKARSAAILTLDTVQMTFEVAKSLVDVYPPLKSAIGGVAAVCRLADVSHLSYPLSLDLIFLSRSEWQHPLPMLRRWHGVPSRFSTKGIIRSVPVALTRSRHTCSTASHDLNSQYPSWL
jgi:hypothetical protein